MSREEKAYATTWYNNGYREAIDDCIKALPKADKRLRDYPDGWNAYRREALAKLEGMKKGNV